MIAFPPSPLTVPPTMFTSVSPRAPGRYWILYPSGAIASWWLDVWDLAPYRDWTGYQFAPEYGVNA